MTDNKNPFVDAARLITQAEYASFIGITRQAINYSIKQKKLPLIKVKGGQLIYLTEEELIKYNEYIQTLPQAG